MRAGVLIFDGFDDLDVVGPYRVLRAVQDVHAGDATPRPETLLIAADPSPVAGSYAVVLRPDTTFADCPPLDMLVVPGGGSDLPRRGRRVAQRHQPTLEFVRHAASGGLTASVCTGAFLLAEAGLLDGRRAATHWSARSELVELMAARGAPFDLVTERVVDDGDIVTAGGVTSGLALAFHLVERLYGPRTRRAVEYAVEAETPPARGVHPIDHTPRTGPRPG